ncbi:MAG: imidazole glycerol phosphate synthase subunit HisH [Clostridia bacterium]|nr:imidazole glycerol phosphate synthase subunit HisH [Clostridia bacterium]
MVGIVDYGVGNLFSLCRSFEAVGENALVSGDPGVLDGTDRIILPGVGAFGDAARKLEESGLGEYVVSRAKAGTPLLGICLGMQLLFDRSYEFGVHRGLGLIAGEVVPLEGNIPQELKIPHIGWNALKPVPGARLFGGLGKGDCVYFVHSYYAKCAPRFVSAYTEYGADITAAAESGNVFGCQFHPEKSGRTGLGILKAFCGLSGG